MIRKLGLFCVGPLFTRNLSSVNSIAAKLHFSQYRMANSKFEYVRDFESYDKCLPNCYIVVRVDGKGFHKFTESHKFAKPNDRDGLLLMSKAAACVMDEFKDITCAYGQSDEYSFIFKRDTNIYNRRTDKIASVVCSLFTSSYVFHWKSFCCRKLKTPPIFDARIILYPTIKNVKDYLSWRQADAHVNNLYNTAFWGLVLKCGHSRNEAEKILCGTVSSEKHEIMFKDCKLNYNNESELFKKGTFIVKCNVKPKNSSSYHTVFTPLNCDIIGDKFWNENSHILNSKLDPPMNQEVGDGCEILFVKFRSAVEPKEKKSRNPQRPSNKGDSNILNEPDE